MNEVETRVYTVVSDLLSVDTVFLFKVRVEASLNIVHYGLPADEGRVRHI